MTSNNEVNSFDSSWQLKYTRAAFLLIGGLAVFRLWLCTYFPILPDETYYWLWSKFLDWSYYSKGPLVAWTIRLGTALAGDTVFGVRWLAVILHAATSLLVFYLAKRLFSARAAFWTLVVSCALPLFAVGSVLMTIDPLSVFFWTAAAVVGWQAYEKNSWAAWLLTGSLVGLGFLAKFTNAIQGICFGIFLLLTRQGRHELKTLKPWAAAILSLLFTTPFWIWNSQHQWITFDHLQSRGSLDHPFRISIREFFQFLQMQAIVFSPLIWAGVMVATLWALKRVKNQGWQKLNQSDFVSVRWVYLLCHFLPLFGFFAVFALNDSGQPNWTVPGYVTALIFSTALWLEKEKFSPVEKGFVIAALGLGFTMTMVLHVTEFLPLPPKLDPLTRVRGWKQLTQKVEEAQQEHYATFVIANRYQLASVITWYRKGDRLAQRAYMAHNPEKIQNQFDFWPGYQDRVGQDAIFVTTVKHQDKPPSNHPEEDYENAIKKQTPKTLRHEFRKVTPLGDSFWIEEKGKKIERFRLFLCEDFLGR
ncbi:MAG: glycosyltransferase family 39 protein [Verrucomicrobiae bacterium]|nr:glycosyltransferase family 39 protein [Verrucomicrobiae bacterium]